MSQYFAALVGGVAYEEIESDLQTGDILLYDERPPPFSSVLPRLYHDALHTHRRAAIVCVSTSGVWAWTSNGVVIRCQRLPSLLEQSRTTHAIVRRMRKPLQRGALDASARWLQQHARRASTHHVAMLRDGALSRCTMSERRRISDVAATLHSFDEMAARDCVAAALASPAYFVVLLLYCVGACELPKCANILRLSDVRQGGAIDVLLVNDRALSHDIHVDFSM